MNIRLILLSLLLLAGSLLAQTAEQPSNIAAIGATYNGSVAGTGIYARKIGGIWSFSAVDAVPTNAKTLEVQTAFSTGTAPKIASLGKTDIYAPVAAGLSYKGNNVGWNWNGGLIASIPVKGKLILPNVRFLKSSVNDRADYQIMVGVLFGWGW